MPSISTRRERRNLIPLSLAAAVMVFAAVHVLDQKPRPSVAAQSHAAAIRINPDEHKQWRATVRYGGVDCITYFDSGATYPTVTRAMAEKIGLKNLRFDQGPMSTANGMVFDAETHLRIEFSGFSVENFAVHVAGGQLGECLMGMSLIQSKFLMSTDDDGVLTLTPKEKRDVAAIQ
jgi:predicted aspartyl protease